MHSSQYQHDGNKTYRDTQVRIELYLQLYGGQCLTEHVVEALGFDIFHQPPSRLLHASNLLCFPFQSCPDPLPSVSIEAISPIFRAVIKPSGPGILGVQDSGLDNPSSPTECLWASQMIGYEYPSSQAVGISIDSLVQLPLSLGDILLVLGRCCWWLLRRDSPLGLKRPAVADMSFWGCNTDIHGLTQVPRPFHALLPPSGLDRMRTRLSQCHVRLNSLETSLSQEIKINTVADPKGHRQPQANPFLRVAHGDSAWPRP